MAQTAARTTDPDDIGGTYLLLSNQLAAVIRRATDGGADEELHAALAHSVARWIVARTGGREVEAEIEKFASRVMAGAIIR